MAGRPGQLWNAAPAALLAALLVVALAACAPARLTREAAPAMTVPRESHTATLLPDGRVLVAGGIGALGGRLSSVELFDPRTSSWDAGPDLSEPRGLHTATALAGGDVLVAGGGSIDSTVASIEIFDVTGLRWRSGGHLSVPRAAHSASPLKDGAVLIAGGWNSSGSLSTAEIVQLNGHVFLAAKMFESRALHAATVLLDGRVLVTGGLLTEGGEGIDVHLKAISGAEIYDPATGNWRSTGRMQEARWAHTANLLPDGTVVVVGGLGKDGRPVENAEALDPVRGEWRTVSRLPGRSHHTATVVRGRNLLLIGGGKPDAVVAGADLEAEPSLPARPDGRVQHAATVLLDGGVLVTGGKDASGTQLKSAEIYRFD